MAASDTPHRTVEQRQLEAVERLRDDPEIGDLATRIHDNLEEMRENGTLEVVDDDE